jgi:hypothetical protein
MASRGESDTGGPAGTAGVPEGAPELIVVLEAGADVVVRRGMLVPDNPPSTAILDVVADAPPDTLAGDHAEIRPLFASNPDRLAAGAPPGIADRAVSSLETYYVVTGLTAGHADFAERLRATDPVAGAYVKGPAYPPRATRRAAGRPRSRRATAAAAPTVLNDMAPRAEEPPSTTPDFSARQGYLEPAPGGVDARWAWTQPGGRGEGVNVIDVEGAWRLTHEDLAPRQPGLLAGTPSDALGWRNHGTAVMGVFGSSDSDFGTTGIAPRASVRTVSIFGDGMGSAAAIKRAADVLRPGDILLIELHRPGPLSGVAGQRGFLPVEWWPDDYDAIVYAVGRSIVVVEAGGNGSQDLDDPAYDKPQAGFPASWRNPFRRGSRDSGAILVGAGAPPQGTHGTNEWGPDRSRLDFSNHGSMVDVQGWGREVTSCGYGDLQGGEGSEDFWYTDEFSGTSSASPIVTGSLACVQGILRQQQATLLTSATARRLLRATGSPQQAAQDAPVTERIGNRPDIKALVAAALADAGQDTHQGGGKVGKEKEQEGGGKSFTKLEKNEFKEMLEQGRRPGTTEDRPTDPALEGRLAAVESAVAELRHFITAEDRPDLSALARGGAAGTGSAGAER